MPESEARERLSWSAIAGILTGVAAVLTALATLVGAFKPDLGSNRRSSEPTVEIATNRYGIDYVSMTIIENRPDICRDACGEDDRCRAYTYVQPGIQGPHGVCWLKSGVPLPTPDACCVSGVKP